MSKLTNTLCGLTVGTAIGIGLGVLFVIDKGENTRKKIKDTISDKVDELKEQLEHLTKNMRDKSLEVESSLEEKVDKLLSESDDKSEDLIDLLEKKLEALKKMAKK